MALACASSVVVPDTTLGISSAPIRTCDLPFRLEYSDGILTEQYGKREESARQTLILASKQK